MEMKPIVMRDAAVDCPRCNADHFNWLECTCFLFCRKVLNCGGIKDE